MAEKILGDKFASAVERACAHRARPRACAIRLIEGALVAGGELQGERDPLAGPLGTATEALGARLPARSRGARRR